MVTDTLLAAAPDWKDSLWSPFEDHVDLSRNEVMMTWRAMFDPREPLCARAEAIRKDATAAPATWTPDVQQVTRWVCGHDDRRATPPLLPDYQVEAWGTVVRELGRL